MKTNVALNKIKTILGMKISLQTELLADGVTNIEADVFEAGAEVFISVDEELVPLPIGEYELQNGDMLIVDSEGIIAEYGAATEEEVPTEEAPKEVETSKERLPKRIVDTITQEQHFSKKKGYDDQAEAPAEAIAEVEAEVTTEVVAIIDELTPDSVTEADASEIANSVIEAVTDTLNTLPEEVAAKALSRIKRFGKTKMSEEEAGVIEEAQAEIVDAVASVVDTQTPDEVTPEISTEIAQTIVDAVIEIVAEVPAELKKQLFNKQNTRKVKNSAVTNRVKLAKERIAKMQQTKSTPARKAIKYNPERAKKTTTEFKYATNKQVGTMDRVFARLFK